MSQGFLQNYGNRDNMLSNKVPQSITFHLLQAVVLNIKY